MTDNEKPTNVQLACLALINDGYSWHVEALWSPSTKAALLKRKWIEIDKKHGIYNVTEAGYRAMRRELRLILS